MKILLYTHVADCDGATPAILLKMVEKDVDVIYLDNAEVDIAINEGVESGLCDKYDQIYITDISPNKEILDKIASTSLCKKIKIFDHHKSQLFANDYDFACVKIDDGVKKLSATSIFYDYLVQKYSSLNTKAIRQFVEVVRAYDTWDWQDADVKMAKGLNRLFSIYGLQKFVEYYTHKLPTMDKFAFDDGEKLVLDVEENRIQMYIAEKDKQLKVVQGAGYRIGVVFADRYRSELGNALAEKHKDDIDMVAMIDCARSISMRSVKDNNINEFASLLGGGGHARSCGVPISDLMRDEIINMVFLGKVEK